MDRDAMDGPATMLEDDLRRGLRHDALGAMGPRPPFDAIARRGRRRARRRRDLALAGVGTAGMLAGALTWRVGGSLDSEPTTVSVASVPEEDPDGLTDEEVREMNLDGWEAWATEPVPPGCEAFAATHPDARGLRKVEVGDSIYQDDREVVAPKDPYAAPGAHFARELDPAAGLRVILGDDGSVLHETAPERDLYGQLQEAGGWVYFVEELMHDPVSAGAMPEFEYFLRRVPSGGGPVEDFAGTPGGYFDVSPDGRWVAVQADYLRGPDVDGPQPSALTMVDTSSGAVHELAIDGASTGSTWGPVWTDEGELLVFARFDDFGMNCTTGQLMGPMVPGPAEAGSFAVALDRLRVYRVDPATTTSLADTAVAWPH